MLTKTIGLTIKDYKIVMTAPLKFFENDDLELIFKVGEFGAVVVDECEEEILTPLFPRDAILFVETPSNVDTIEAVSINGDEISFRLTNKYSHKGNIGIGRMQIVLLDEGSRKALPPFEFEIQPIIYQESSSSSSPILYDGLMDEQGVSLCSEDMMLLDSTDEVYGIKISELPFTDEVVGFIPIVQYGETKRINVETINEKAINDMTLLMEDTVDTLIGETVPTLVDAKISEGLKYSNPASPNITDFKSALDYLLYYDLSISLHCNQPTTLEIGSTVESILFTWGYNKDGIKSQSFNGEDIHDVAVREYIYNVPLSSNKTFTLTATDERKTFSKSIAFNFRHGRYWGVSSKEMLESSDILSMSKELATGRGKTFTVMCDANMYIYYCYPSSWGVGAFSVGGFVGGFELIDTIDFTNNSGHTSSYYVYRSTNHSLGNTTVTVS